MRNAVVVLSAAVLVACLAGLSSAGVKIMLKNGRTINAEACRDVKGKLMCDLEGGTFEIDRQDIAGTQDLKLQKQILPETGDESGPGSGEKAPGSGKSMPSEKLAEKGAEVRIG